MSQARLRVAVVGATGTLGRPLVAELVSAGHRVVAVGRTRATLEALAGPAVEPCVADLADPGTLGAACRGVDAVVATAHAMLGRGRARSEVVDGAGHRALIGAAAAAGVRHVVYTSVLGASPDHPVDFWRTKYQVEQHLRASGVPWTIVRPSAFMEVHAHALVGAHVLAGRVVPILGSGTRPRNLVAARDVARLIATVSITPAAHGRVLEIGGPENLSDDQVAALYGRLAGRVPRLRHLPPPVLRVMAPVAAMLHPGIARVLRTALAAGRLDQTFDPAPLLREFPMRLTTLEEVAREQVAVAAQRPAGRA